MYCNHINCNGSDVISWNTNQKSFIMHKWSQLRYTNELFPNWGNWSFCFWLLHRSFVLSPCFSALISLLHWACTLTSQRLFSRSRALTWSLLFALLQFALFAQSPAPFWSSARSTMLILSLVCTMHASLRWAHFLAFLRSFSCSAALVRSLRCARSLAPSTAHI